MSHPFPLISAAKSIFVLTRCFREPETVNQLNNIFQSLKHKQVNEPEFLLRFLHLGPGTMIKRTPYHLILGSDLDTFYSLTVKLRSDHAPDRKMRLKLPS